MTAKTFAVLLASLLLAGCGNKGPLVLPSVPVPEEGPLPEAARPVPDPDALPQVEPEADTGVDAIEPNDIPADPPMAG
ncbi:lipoprotein [Lysobacter korlensis]|uniref:Lipoprotein n=1 Tax=Lysobacter korlensis TaxID=553636 RepID=A0ABV6RI27_9GAMM